MHDGGLFSESVHKESGDDWSLLVLFSVTTVFGLMVGEERPTVDKLEYNRKTLQPVQLRQ